MTTSIKVTACCDENTVISVGITEDSGTQNSVLESGESMAFTVYASRKLTVQEVPCVKQSTEEMIQDKGLNATRLTPVDIEATIAKCDYHIFEGSQLTVCCLTLNNGFTVTGESACVSPENFDQEIGEKIARENAWHKIWALEGYLLKEKLHAN